MLLSWRKPSLDTPAPARYWRIALVLALLVATIVPVATSARDDRHDRRDEVDQLAQTEPLQVTPDGRRQYGRQAKVVGGAPVAQGTYTFAVFLVGSPTDRPSFNCGGSLIAPRFVLTAAHCVEDQSVLLEPGQFSLIVGKADWTEFRDANVFGVSNVWQHPQWDRVHLTSDVAVLELDRAVPSSLATPITLIGSGDTHLDQPGQPLTLVGWGQTSGGGPTSQQLLWADLNVVSDAICSADSVLCAAAPNKSACFGDSGGPLFATFTESARHGTARGATANKRHEVKAEKKKHKKHKKGKKHKKKKGGGSTPPPPPPPAQSFTQIGVTSFVSTPDCPPGVAGGYARLSAPAIHAFIESVIGG